MCLMLYLATSGEQPLQTAPELTIFFHEQFLHRITR